ncbi:MAG TPA: histidine triad nucleotide-binding protein [Firmicutes bacterium]|nr:MAG: HIT family hydrolase [Peptococcaceae bacterium 1109]HHT73135.1 histidine triad nucleotide-binding protein [Bacillota bacterium]
MNKDCLFCRIAAGEIPSDIVFENERIVAFRDINPVAPVHILVIPKEHIASMAHLKEEHQALMGEIMTSIQKLAEQEKLDDGFRVVVNTGRDGGQTVSHLHFHLIGGRGLQWPPG